MSPKAVRHQINAILKIVKESVASRTCEFLDTRKKNIDTLAELSWLVNPHVVNMIHSLTYLDYSSGPDPDMNDAFRPETIWTFAKEIGDRPGHIYFKFCVVDAKNVVCISFHIAEHEPEFPYR